TIKLRLIDPHRSAVAYMNGLSPRLRRFPLFESRFDGEQIFMFAVLRMSFEGRPSPGETAPPCRADYIFGEYLGQCVAELSVEYGNLSDVAHRPNSQRSKKALRHCTNLSPTTLGQNSANFHLGLGGELGANEVLYPSHRLYSSRFERMKNKRAGVKEER